MGLRFLTEPQLQALLRAARSCSDPLAQRDYWWMQLMLHTGARVAEFSRWTVAMAEQALATGWIVVPRHMRKGKRCGHEYAVTQSVREALRALLEINRREAPLVVIDGGADLPLIWGRDGQRLSVRSYQARIKHWGRVAGLAEGISPHWLRHTRGVRIIHRSKGANPLKTVQLALGHANLGTTGIYTQMARHELALELQAVDGKRMPRKEAVRAAAEVA